MSFKPIRYSLYTGTFLIFPILILVFVLQSTEAPASSKNFPLYPKIRTNVQFWQNIYEHYSLNEAVIHDSEDLSKVYEVIPLLESTLPGGKRINTKTRKRAKKKYAALLKKLSVSSPVNREEIRIASLFSGKNRKKRMARAAANVRSQKGQKERFRTGVLQSRTYINEMKKIFRRYQMPEDLAYLPHVESSFNTRAYSKFGAAGIWQFTRTTGKQYLTITYSIDERLDPILATHAAAKYLQNSYRTLGNWPLALTSYNYGTSGMLRALNEQGSYEKIFTHYNKGHFKFASRNFYPEFLAALNVAKKLEKTFRSRPGKSRPYQYFTLPGYLHIKKLANHLSISIKSIKKNNPALRPPTLRGEKLIPRGYVLRLPAGKTIQRKITSIPSSSYNKKQLPSPFHRVQKGETAGAIARQHTISLKKLMQANNLDKYATIYIKQKLRIPGRHSTTTADTATSAGNFHPILLAYKKNRPAEQESRTLPAKDPTVYNVFNTVRKNGRLYGYITVQPEESMGLYSGWLATTRDKILHFNNLKAGANIEPGQRLRLVFDKVPPGRFENKRLDFLQETEDDFFSAYSVIGQTTYRVNSGDTLWDLCYNKFDIPIWLLERYNSTLNLAHLNPAQKLIIPIIQAI